MKTTSVFRLPVLMIPLWMSVLLPAAEQPVRADVRLIVSQPEERSPHRTEQDRITRMSEQDNELLDKFVAHESRFKDHYQSHFLASHYEYHQYRPAYQRGFELGLDPRYGKKDWSSVEPEARRTWDEPTMGLWNQYKDAVRYGWEQGVALGRK